MARVICPKCGEQFDVCNHDKMTVGAFHDNTDNVIGVLIPAEKKGDKEMVSKVEALKSAGFTEEQISKMVGIIGFNKDEVIKSDEVSEVILNNRGAMNSVSFRRWITAQFVHAHFNYDGGVQEYINKKDYNWQFKMMIEELNVLAKMQRKDDEEFAIRSKFFSLEVVRNIVSDYAKDLERFTKHLVATQKKHCKGVPYIKYRGFKGSKFHNGCCFTADIHSKITGPVNSFAWRIKNVNTYEEMYQHLRNFFKWGDFIKLPYDTKKSKVWVDTFKASGAYYSMMNLSQFSDLVIRDYDSKRILTKYEAKRYLNNLVGNKTGFEMYGQFKQMLEDNCFTYKKFEALCKKSRESKLESHFVKD